MQQSCIHVTDDDCGMAYQLMAAPDTLLTVPSFIFTMSDGKYLISLSLHAKINMNNNDHVHAALLQLVTPIMLLARARVPPTTPSDPMPRSKR